MLTLVKDANIFTPKPIGRADLLYLPNMILQLGKLDHKALLASSLEIEVMDAKGYYMIPGLIDPHAHLLGGSGENGGFHTQTPEISLTELTLSGITTVVGTLGADTTMKTMAGLLAKAKGLNEESLNARIYTGGYSLPPTTIMPKLRDDLMFIEEVIGTGEIAISDERSDEPKPSELARIVVDTHLGGMLANKAGISHFHVGPGLRRLQCLRDLLEDSPDIKAEWLYPTHIERTEQLISEAVELTKIGCFVDMDVAEGELAKNLRTYRSCGGSFEKLTVSSDASITSPGNILREMRNCVLKEGFELEEVLKLVTKNPATVLKLEKVGELKSGHHASFVLLEPDSLEVTCVVSKGRKMVENGRPVAREKFLEGSNRRIDLKGDKA